MFLNPWLLLGTSGIAVPIIIHLLNRRKFQRVVWAAMRFIQVSLEKNRRRMRIEDLILLMLRCLIVFVLALALARPTLHHANALFGQPPVTAVILLDNSYSMGKSDGMTTRFEAAKKAADEALAGLPNGSSAAVLLFSDVVMEVIPQPTSDLNLARQKVRQAALSDRSTNVFAGLSRAYKTLSTVPGVDKEVYLITDTQALGWQRSQSAGAGGGGNEILRLLQENKEQVATRVVVVPDADSRDVAVSAIRLTTELPTVNKVLRFEVEATNEGNVEARDVAVRLFVDDSTAPVEEAVIDVIPPHHAKSVALSARLRSDGYHGITARITPDALPADDARSMVVRVLKQVQVLLVDGEAGREGREEDTFFVREALQPVPAEQRPGYFIQTRTVTAAELPQTSLDSFDAVVLANVGELPRTMVAALERNLAEGRGLVVFPGPNTNAGFYTDVLYRQRGILPAGLGSPVGDSGQGERFETLQSSRFEHPIMNLWNEEGRGSPGVAHFFRMYDLNVPPPAATTQAGIGNAGGPAAIVASYANGKPAIVEHTYGEGRVVLFGSTANTAWNDLPVRASVFIPLMHRVLDSLLQRENEHLNVPVGQRFVLRCTGEALGNDAQVQRPGLKDAAAALPDAVHVETAGNWPEVVYDRTDVGGIYRVAVEGQEPVLFAVQPDAAESDLSPLTEMELAQVDSVGAKVVEWKPGVMVARASGMVDVGMELWRPLALAVLALAVLETLLAYWFSRVK